MFIIKALDREIYLSCPKNLTITATLRYAYKTNVYPTNLLAAVRYRHKNFSFTIIQQGQ